MKRSIRTALAYAGAAMLLTMLVGSPYPLLPVGVLFFVSSLVADWLW